MKISTPKLTTLAVVLATSLSLGSTAVEAKSILYNSNPGKTDFATRLATPVPVRKAKAQAPWSNPGEDINAKLRQRNVRAQVEGLKEPEPTHSFSNLGFYDFLDAPDGSLWFYTSEFETKLVATGGTDFNGNPYTEEQIVAFTFTVYDDTFTHVATLHDDIVFGQDETRVASASLDPVLTRFFFNNDDKIEVMVYLAMNTGASNNYEVRYHNKIYQFDGQKDENGNDICLLDMSGRCVDALNVGNSENEEFYLTFVNDITPDVNADYDSFIDFINAYKSVITVYGASTDDKTPTEILEKDIHLVQYPGDTTDGIYFISKKQGSTPYFIFSYYEKPYFIDPTGMAGTEETTPDNNFVIETYNIADGKPNKLSLTSIPVVHEVITTSIPYTFYSIGSLAWQHDVDMEVNGTPSTPAYIVAVDHTTAANLEEVLTDYVIYGNDGKMIKALAEETDGVMMLSDVEGNQPQAIFLSLDGDLYILNFVDLYSAKTVLTLPQVVEGESLTVTGDRVSDGKGSYKYAFVLLYDTMDDDKNQYTGIIWINPDGKIDHIDRVNIGKNVARASVNMAAKVLDPHLYDADDDMEYAVLVERYVGGANSTLVETEFMVVDNDGKPMATFKEDAQKGSPYLFSLVFNDEQNRLMMVYQKNYTTYHVDLYDLPFVKLNDDNQEGGVSDVNADKENLVSFDGNTVTAQGCEIAVYATSGAKVLSGQNKLTVDTLVPGVYMVIAKDADKRINVLKIVR